MKESGPAGHDVVQHSSRRRAVRIDAPSNLTIALSGERLKARVTDIGLGGLGLITNLPLAKGRTYTVLLRMDAHVATCDARAAHCRRRADGLWTVGLSFVRDERLRLVERLVDAITGDLIQFS